MWKNNYFCTASQFPCFGLGVVFPSSNYSLVCYEDAKWSSTVNTLSNHSVHIVHVWGKNQFGHFLMLSVTQTSNNFQWILQILQNKGNYPNVGPPAASLCYQYRISFGQTSINFLSLRYHRPWRALNKNKSVWESDAGVN